MFNEPTKETPIQEYLRSGATLQQLELIYGVKSYEHPELPLVGFKYNMIDAPKTEPIVRSCRGTVLERDTWNMVAQPFYRFFNYGEHLEETSNFNWGDFTATTKEDGSLMIVYYYGGEWHVNTSGSFGLQECGFSGKDWGELFWETSGIDKRNMRKEWTYIFELCTVWNKVVRMYESPRVYLLGIINSVEGNVYELDLSAVRVEGANRLQVHLPKQHHFESYDDVKLFLQQQEESDPTFEGVVLRDNNGMRMKVKTATYLALHRAIDNGNGGNPKNIIPLVLTGETDEILTYFPELADAFAEVQERLEKEFDKLVKTWERHHKIEEQKDFALAIIPETKFNGLLFQLRKNNGTVEDLAQMWRDSADMIHKFLWKS